MRSVVSILPRKAAAAQILGCSTTAAAGLISPPLLVQRRHWSDTTVSDEQKKQQQQQQQNLNKEANKKKKSPTVFESITSLDMPDYQIERAFDEPFMQLLFEGHDVDYKKSVREALLEVAPKRETNFTSRTGVETSLERHRNVLKLLKALGTKGVISFAEIRSTARHFPSFYEVLATYDAALALSAAEHFTFATMVATHAHPEIQSQILDHVDSFKVIGAVASTELAAGDEAPYNTEGRWDTAEQCFYLRGAAKFAVVNAASAHWVVVTATVTAGKDENRGVQLLFVPIRGHDGQLLPGVTIRYFPHQGNATLDACGAGVIHFDHVRLTAAHLPKHVVMSRIGEVLPAPGISVKDFIPAAHTLNQRRRIASAGLYTGLLKAQHTMLQQFASTRHVVGHAGTRTHPLFGVQHVQTAIVTSFVKSLVHFFGWLTIVPAVTNSEVPPSGTDETNLAGVVYSLQESLLESSSVSQRILGIHSALESSPDRAIETIVALRSEGYDSSMLIREVAYRSVVFDQGTTHWGWKVAGILQRIPMIDRFIKNPMYSPRLADLNRHLLFFSHKHYATKRRLQRYREIERRKGGAEYLWYDWNTFRHRQVKHCGEAYLEVFHLECTMKVLEKSYDPRGRKLVRDMGWIYACSRLEENLEFHLQQRMLSLNKAQSTQSHLDHIVTVMAPQTMNLVATFMIPEGWRAPAGREPYWTIPGTTTGVERGEAVTLRQEPSKADSNRKEDQEELREDPKEFDYLHGMDKK